MRQTGGTHHQGKGNKEHINRALGPRGVLIEAELRRQAIQFVHQIDTRPVGKRAAKTQLGHRVSRHHHGDKNCRDQVGKNQHTVLGYLGIGNTFHATEHGVKKDHAHPQ